MEKYFWTRLKLIKDEYIDLLEKRKRKFRFTLDI